MTTFQEARHRGLLAATLLLPLVPPGTSDPLFELSCALLLLLSILPESLTSIGLQEVPRSTSPSLASFSIYNNQECRRQKLRNTADQLPLLAPRVLMVLHSATEEHVRGFWLRCKRPPTLICPFREPGSCISHQNRFRRVSFLCLPSSVVKLSHRSPTKCSFALTLRVLPVSPM
ncbi:hypothetical protein Y032_0154g2967 [Ancylostoma ceylanicum]|uniref:Secreted protein n=2 Tax=Ancylostoma ceylanicum TaxID=53326 RepID=A0A016SYZ7_9BILA|nr:hypothetical protein Y032_0154g2967 [Ancylostoma ceylanicum]